MKTRKLSPKQAEIVELLRNGWELGVVSGYDTWAYVQKGKCGHGGEAKRCSISTYHALAKRGLLEEVRRRYPTIAYRLKSQSASHAEASSEPATDSPGAAPPPASA